MFAFLRKLVSIARKNLVEGGDRLQLLLSRSREGMNSLLDQCTESGS